MSTNYYFEVKNLDDFISKIRNFTGEFAPEETLNRLKIELSNIHICKFSGGWKPLFESSHYFSNMTELEDYYNRNADTLIIKDEYDEIISWDDFKKSIYNSNNFSSHISYANHKGWNNDGEYYTDDLGYEWYKGEFS